jgi:Protein of unknown function (DUF4232)
VTSIATDAADVSLRLLFDGAGGRQLAKVVERPSGSVGVTIGGRDGPPLVDEETSVTGELGRLGALPVCPGSGLQPSAGLPGRVILGESEYGMTFRFRNRSRVICRLEGYPRVLFLDAAGRPLPTHTTDLGRSSFRAEYPPAILYPGQSGSFGATWSTCQAAHPARVRISLPGVAERFVLAAGSHAHPLAPCGGRVTISLIG